MNRAGEHLDGVWLVDIGGLADPALVPQAVASVLGVHERASRPLIEAVVAYLRPRSVLLVLDGCEHLVEACAEIAVALLHACPKLRILATSRRALGVAGETLRSVPGLRAPDPG